MDRSIRLLESLARYFDASVLKDGDSVRPILQCTFAILNQFEIEEDSEYKFASLFVCSVVEIWDPMGPRSK